MKRQAGKSARSKPRTAADEARARASAKKIREGVPPSSRESPFSLVVKKLSKVYLHRVPDLRRHYLPKVRLAFVSMPQALWTIERFSTLQGSEAPPEIKDDTLLRTMVSFNAEEAARTFTAFRDAITFALVKKKANVVCVSELGFPTGPEMLPSQAAIEFARQMSEDHQALIIAGTAHDSRTLYNTGYLFYPGCPDGAVTFHKALSAVSIGELVSVPTRRKVIAVEIFRLKIAVMICLDIADYPSVASVIRVNDQIDMILAPCYTRKFERMIDIATVASKALPGYVALVNANLTRSAAGRCKICLFGGIEKDLRAHELASGASISVLEIPVDKFTEKKLELKAEPDSEMAWLFGRQEHAEPLDWPPAG